MKTIRLWAGIVCVLCTIVCFAQVTQQVTALQYFYDTDPGVGVAGNGAVISVAPTGDLDQAYSFPLPGSFTNGFHHLYVRAQDEFGRWSIAERRTFYVTDIAAGTRNLIAYQYFFDNDPGVGLPGNGAVVPVTSTADLNTNLALAVPSLASGFHQFYLRTQDDLGHWSIAEHRMFYVSDITSGTGNIIAHQYYFDTDPGVGVAGNGAVTPIASTADYIATLAITVPALGNGIHQLYLRTQDEFGHWSIAERRMFYVTQITEGTRNIVTYQYFFDSDPGVGVQGNGAVLSVASTADFSSTVAIAMPALSGGLHQLYFRTKDDLGRWSIAERRMFYLNGASYSSPTVSALEYYYDMDPGVGNGNPVSIAATADIDSNFLFGVPCLSSGTHYLYVRAKDEQGNWSIIERDTLQITSGIEPAVVIPSGPINLCAGEEITLSTTPVPSVTYQWVESGDPISGETDPSIVITTAGNYALRSYCGSAFIVSNTVIVTDLPLVTFYADSDEDGYGDANVVIQDCSQPTGFVSNNDDCNDADMSIHPGASEICNLIDDNCNGTIDEGGQNLFFADTDNDSFGNPDVTQLACFQPAGFVTNDEDCNDFNNTVHPNAIELCNGLDDNCDGLIDADDPTVIDTEAPTITCLNEISVNNDAGACQANVAIPPPAVTDDCIGASTALRFDGSFQFVDPQTFTSVSNNFTIEMWVNPTAVHEIDGQTTGSVDGVSGQRYALWPTHGFGWNGVDAGAGISVGTNGISVYEHADSYMPPILVYEAPITGWTHLSVVYVNKQPSLYVNGALVATGLVSPRPNIHPSAGNGWSYPGQSGGIGGGSYGNFMGDIDEVRIWNYSRSQSEIQGDFLTHLTGMESGLFLYYDFEDGTGSTTAQDASTSNLNGILNNMDPATDWIQPGSPVSSSVTLQNDFNDSSNASGLYPLGTTLVTWTATDAAGNSATCSFNVIVHDTEAPVFSECPTGIEDEAEEGQWGAHVSWTEPAATDNCEMQSTSATHAPGDFFNVGSTEVSYTALDIHGNSSTCSFTVEVSPPDILGSVNLSIFANDIQFSNSNPAPGTFINVSATVHNNSNVAAASFVCHLLNQYDNTTYPDIIVPALAANQSTVVTWNIQTPADPAFVPMQVTIDYLNNVTESNELDNQAIRPFVNGSLPFSGHIVVVANAIPYSAIAGSGISICGNAYYDDTAIPLIDSSVAGAQVTVTIAETGQVLYGVTNSNGYFCIGYSTPNTAGLYHFIAAVTDFTLTGDTTGTFQLVPPPVDYCPTDLSIGLELYGSFLCGNAYHIVQGSSLTGIVNIYNGCHSVSTPTTLFIALPDGTPVPGPYIIPSLAPGEAYSLLLPEMTFNTVGSTYISATVDFFNGVAEDNESNNSRSIPIQVHPPLPDITPTQGWVSTDYQCETASVSFRIDNTGGIPTGGFNTVLEIYQGSTLETSFTQTVSSIPALCYTYVTFVFDPQFSGEYHFNLYCDTMPSVVTELSDVNNSLSMTHFFQPCNFDLVVHGCGSMDVKPTNPVSPGSITLYATIGNYGQLPVTTPFVVNFIAGETTYPVPVTQTIPANSSVNVSVTIPTPAFGNNDLTVEVDANHEVTELNESNNTNSAKLCWDFVLTNTSCSGGSPLHGTQFICNPIQLAIGLYNLGLYEASNLKVKFEVSGPGISGWSNLGFATVFVDNTCGCPQIVNLSSSFLFPQTGFYDVRITADFQNLYTECFEDNNQLVLPVQVVENADYSVYSQFIAPSELNPDINEPVTFNLTYKNEGCTGLSPVELYMQMDNTPHDSVSAIALASNALNTYSMSQPWSSALPGVHVIRAVIDHDQALVEGNELNNEATRSIIVGGAPNFNLFALGSSNMSPLQGETVSLTCSIINEGQNIADGTLQFYFVNAQEEEVLIDQQSIHLAEGETLDKTVLWFVTYPYAKIIARISNVDPVEYDFTDNEQQLKLSSLAVAISSTDVACNGIALGILEASINGGQPPYFVQWSNGFTGEIVNVPAGIYSVLVTDVNGLQAYGVDTVNALAIPVTWYADADQDGYGNGSLSLLSCTTPEGYVLNTEDCDDTDASIHPLATEVCDTKDNDCDGFIDDADTSVVGQALWYQDYDGDNYGNPDIFLSACYQPGGYVGTGTDCDDNDADKHPDGNEVLDGKDNDCDGLIDEGLSVISVDAGDCMVVYHGYAPTECAVLNVNVQGGAEPYIYNWSHGAQTASTVVCPEVTTIYEVTVTDQNGLTAQDVVTVQVIDISCGNNKVTVCHLPPGNPSNVQTICISVNAVATHLAQHGDYLGLCDAVDPCEVPGQPLSNSNLTTHSFEENHDDMNILEVLDTNEDVDFALYPNPANAFLDIQLPGIGISYEVTLYDVSGKLLMSRSLESGLQKWSTADLENGVYIIRIQTETVKMSSAIVVLH